MQSVGRPTLPQEFLDLHFDAATLTEIVQRYCVVCHNDQMLTGNVSLQTFDVGRAGEDQQFEPVLHQHLWGQFGR